MINDKILREQLVDRRALTTTILRPTANLLENFIKQYDKLDSFAKIRLLREVHKIRHDFSLELKTFLLDRIDKVILLTLILYNDLLPNPLDDDTLSRIRWSVLNHIVYDQFQSMNLGMRIDRSVARTFQSIESDLTFSMAMSKKAGEVAKDIKKHLISMGQVSGGSAQMWNERILIGEQLRAYQETVKAICIVAGITEIRWVNHDTKPTPDMCKSLQGTYQLYDIPDYPYPGCTCAIEPIIQ